MNLNKILKNKWIQIKNKIVFIFLTFLFKVANTICLAISKAHVQLKQKEEVIIFMAVINQEFVVKQLFYHAALTSYTQKK